MKLVATCFQGLEDVLYQELQDIGAREIQKSKRSIYFKGDLKTLYTANYKLRTAIRILAEIGTSKIHSFSDLYHSVREIQWDEYFDLKQSFAVSAVTYSKFFKHSKYVALKAKDAIADYFRSKYNSRPNVDPKDPAIQVHIYINDRNLYIHLDSSGQSLHKRSYKSSYNTTAPMSEVLAAGLIKLSEWDPNLSFYNPMCGSGTITIEACLYALNISPQIKRREFSFLSWKNYNPQIWNDIKEGARKEIKSSPLKLFCSDISDYEIKSCRRNIEYLKLDHQIKSFEEDIFAPVIKERPLHIIINPPYDKRLPLDDSISYYKNLGDTLKQHFKNCEAWIFSGNKEAIKHVGLKPSRKISLYNGPIESKFYKFEIF